VSFITRTPATAGDIRRDTLKEDTMDFLEKLVKGVGVVVIALIIVVLLSIIGAYPTKWLVNYLFTPATLVALFGGPLTFWKALALSYVCASLFKGTTTEVKK
jgi:hypothetical protein